jgi:hypothetical protein
MTKSATAAALAAALALGLPAQAAEEHGHEHEHGKVQHYEGKQAETLQEAVENLRAYNARLEQQLSKELTPARMDRIHRLSYTLENALRRINVEIDQAARRLESMHLASESMEQDTVKTDGKAYLDGLDALVSRK